MNAAHSLDLEGVDEADLTVEDKTNLMWRTLMGYGFGTTRVPGILEQIRESQRVVIWGVRILVGLVGVFGLLNTHSTISEIINWLVTHVH